MEQQKSCAETHPWLAPSVVCLFIALTYVSFVLFGLWPSLEPVLSGSLSTADRHAFIFGRTETWAFSVAFHVLFLLFVWSFLRAMLTPPGQPAPERWRKAPVRTHETMLLGLLSQPPDVVSEVEQRILKRLVVVERKAKNLDLRWCKWCRLYKPDRTHHCRLCQRCTLRMDHHCPWIYNCIGFHNHKFFILFLLYGALTSLFLVGTMIPRVIKVFRPITDPSYFFTHDLPVAITFAIALFGVAAFCTFLSVQLWLLFQNVSTLEHREKRTLYPQNPTPSRRWTVVYCKYNQGSWLRNARVVMGPLYSCLLPIAPFRSAPPSGSSWEEWNDPGTFVDCAGEKEREREKQGGATQPLLAA